MISNAPNIQYNPDVAFGGGYYMVVWSDGRTVPYYQIYGARVTPGGSVMEPSGILVGPNNTLFQYYPSLAFGGTRFLAVWTYGTSPYQIMGRFINTNGTLGDTIMVAIPGGYTYGTRLASNGTNYFVAWVEYTGSDYAAKGVVLDNNGARIMGPFTIASGIYYYNSMGLAFDGHNFIVTYSILAGSVYQIYGRFYSPSGAPLDTAFRISNSDYNCYYGDVIAGANDHCLNVWCDARSTYDIYGNVDVEVGIEEGTGGSEQVIALKSTIVTNAIELRNYSEGKEARIYDVSGCVIGDTRRGRYDCSKLDAGVYILKIGSGSSAKVIKVK